MYSQPQFLPTLQNFTLVINFARISSLPLIRMLLDEIPLMLHCSYQGLDAFFFTLILSLTVASVLLWLPFSLF